MEYRWYQQNTAYNGCGNNRMNTNGAAARRIDDTQIR
jgi:hypothetical protein